MYERQGTGIQKNNKNVSMENLYKKKQTFELDKHPNKHGNSNFYNVLNPTVILLTV